MERSDDELPSVDDPATARVLRASLEKLRTGRDPVLRDLAEDILAGRLSLRDVTTSNAALPALRRALGRYTEWQASLSKEEFSKVIDQTQQAIGRLREQAESEGDDHA